MVFCLFWNNLTKIQLLFIKTRHFSFLVLRKFMETLQYTKFDLISERTWLWLKPSKRCQITALNTIHPERSCPGLWFGTFFWRFEPKGKTYWDQATFTYCIWNFLVKENHASFWHNTFFWVELMRCHIFSKRVLPIATVL